MNPENMSMLDVHADALERSVTKYHEFIARYSKNRNVVYGFVEGKDDPSFYRGFIEGVLPGDWDVELWPAGNKDKVFEIYRSIDWRKFRKSRICFFVDRDLSDLVPESMPSDRNIFVTPNYSIENDVANSSVCKRLLAEVYGLDSVDHAELDSAGELFKEECDKFCELLALIMSWIVLWKREGKKPCLNDIQMKDIFQVVIVGQTPRVGTKINADISAYIHNQCNITREASWDVSNIALIVREGQNYRKYARGKYVFWFLIEFCNAIHAHSCSMFSKLEKPPKIRTNISHKTGMAIVGTRARIPELLKSFLNVTYLDFISSRAA